MSQGAPANVESDGTVKAFAQWLTEMKAKNNRTLHEMLSEMSVIRDSITKNNVELADFKRDTSGVSQQMQSQLTDLREKLTSAFKEITALVNQKNQSDQELMQDLANLQGNLSCKTTEIENLKRSYSQAHQQLQSSLIQITNHLAVTQTEVASATQSCERVQSDTSHKLSDIVVNLRGLEDTLSVGNSENRNSMLQLQEEIARIHESIASVGSEFGDHKRATNSVHGKLQSQVWSLEEGKKRQDAFIQAENQAMARVEASFMPPRAAEVAMPTYATHVAAAPSMVSSVTPPLPTIEGRLPQQPTELIAMARQAPLQPSSISQAPSVETITLRGVPVPCYMDHHLATMHPMRLREHAQLLHRTLGFEVIGSMVPANDHELAEWISRVHRFHVIPSRSSGATTSGSMVRALSPTAPTPSAIPSVQTATVITPGMATRPPVMMSRQPMVFTSSPLR
jgi:predicted  nucleic acid-binding Zn-ribbon protein